MFDTLNTGQKTKQNDSKILTTNVSTISYLNNLKSNEVENLEFTKENFSDVDKSIEYNDFFYNDVNINELDIPPFIKEMLMKLILENEEYEKLAIELQSKCNKRSSTENARNTRSNSEYYALLKKTEDLTEIINNAIKYKKIKNLVI